MSRNAIKYVRWLPFGASAIVLTPRLVLVHRRVLKWDAWEARALLAHETEHRFQMQSVGTILWWLRYIFCTRLRLEYEAEAYATQAAILHQATGRSLDEYVRAVSVQIHRRYLWWFPLLRPSPRLERIEAAVRFYLT